MSVFFELFNTKAGEFVKDIATAFPHLAEIRAMRSGLQMLSTIDAKAPCRMFSQHVLSKYRTALLERDEETFLNHDIDIGAIADDGGQWTRLIDCLRGLWKNLDEASKVSIWNHLRVLVVVADKCVAS
jgi:hypothetical protein